MKRQTSKTIGLISALLICTGSTVTAFADAAPASYLRGDIDFNGKVEIEDAQIALKAYTNLVSQKPSGLRDPAFQAANVVRNGELDVTDAQCILKYYTDKDVAGKTDTTWEKVVGYDLLDDFYQAKP